MRLLLILLIAFTSAAAQAAAPSRVRADVFVTDDSDDATQQSYVLNLETRMPQYGRDAYWSVGAGARIFDADEGSETFTVTRADLQMDPSPGTRLDLRLQKLFGDDWSPLLGGASLAQQLSQRWRLEVSADRDIVDTVVALRNRTHVNGYSAALDYGLARNWTLVGGVSLQDLSDGNDRLGRTFRLVYAPQGSNWNVQTRVRRIDSDFRGVGYFSPERLEDAVLLGRISWPLSNDRYVVSIQAGGGAQRVDGGDSEALYQAELRGRGWVSDHYGFEARLSCANTGGLNAAPAGDGYRYCEGLLSLIAAW